MFPPRGDSVRVPGNLAPIRTVDLRRRAQRRNRLRLTCILDAAWTRRIAFFLESQQCFGTMVVGFQTFLFVTAVAEASQPTALLAA